MKKRLLLNLLFMVTIGFVNTDCNPFGSQMGKKIDTSKEISVKKPSVSKENDDPFAHGGDVEDENHGTDIKEAWPFTCWNYYDMFWMNLIVVLGFVIAQTCYTVALYNKENNDGEGG